jgi:hypothetical protein
LPAGRCAQRPGLIALAVLVVAFAAGLLGLLAMFFVGGV